MLGDTYYEVIAAAAEARKHLAKLDHRLQAELDHIDFSIIFEEGRRDHARALNRRRELRAVQNEVRDAFTQLAYVTAQRLGNSDEVSRLKKRVEIVTAILAKDLARLRKIEQIAELVARVSDAVADVVSKLAKQVTPLMA